MEEDPSRITWAYGKFSDLELEKTMGWLRIRSTGTRKTVKVNQLGNIILGLLFLQMTLEVVRLAIGLLDSLLDETTGLLRLL